MTTLSPAAQANEKLKLLSEWFYYDPSSPSCVAWKKPPFNGRRKAGDHCTYFAKYYRVMLNGTWYQCHHIVLVLHGFTPSHGQVADHINRDRKDNRIANLRWVSGSQNRRNTCARATSGWKHARITREGNYQSNYRLPDANKTLYCGRYPTAYEAHLVALAHKLQNYWTISA